MRRSAVIMALGALLSVLAGAVTASPALAGRGDGWQLYPFEPETATGSCPFGVFIDFPVSNAFQKLVKPPPGGSLTW